MVYAYPTYLAILLLIDAVYPCKVYWLCWSVLALLLLLLVQAASSYSFVLPHLLPLRFDHEAGWSGRFQLSTLQLFASLQLLCAALRLRVWPAADLTAAHYDKLYSLAMLKHEQHRGASAKSDEVTRAHPNPNPSPSEP